MYRSAVKHTFNEIVRDKKHQRSGKDKSLPLFAYLLNYNNGKSML